MMLYSILVAIDVLLAASIIGLVLIQQGKGADVGAAFGSGASGTVFGSRGSASFMARVTAILAALFFANSLLLAYLASHRPVAESVIDLPGEVIEEMVDIPGATSLSDERPPQALVEESDLPDLPETDIPDEDILDLDLPETDIPRPDIPEAELPGN